jgi:pPIWI_RE module N-terminal domain/RNaseH domain of pPIWI_RE/MID domain of pPIWI_RE
MKLTPLQLTAFTLCHDDLPLELYGLPFPNAWRQPLINLERERANRQDVTLPIRSLNAVILALVPQLLVTPNQAREDRPEFWLLAHQEINPQRIWMIVQAWMAEHYHSCPSFAVIQNSIRVEDLNWAKVTQNLVGPVASNGTAHPDPLAFTVIPAYLAEMLVQSEVKIRVGGEERALRRVQTVMGAELQTWPPVYFVDRQQDRWGYSYTVQLTLQTQVGNPKPRVHAHYGVRRWVSRAIYDGDKLFLDSRDRSVYLASSQPWLDVGSSDTFTIGRLRARFDGSRRIPVWADSVAAIAARLGLRLQEDERLQSPGDDRLQLPDAERLARDPLHYLEPAKGLVAAIVEVSQTIHPVNPGLGLEIHEETTERLAEAFEGTVKLLPPLTRLELPQQRGRLLLKDDLREIDVAQRLEAVTRSIGPQVTIEVWWQTETCRDLLVDRIQSLFLRDRPELTIVPESSKRKRLEPELSPAPETITIPLPEGGRLEIITQRLGPIADSLTDPGQPLKSARERGAYKRRATNERIAKIRGAIPPVEEPTLTLIELANYQQDKALRRLLRIRDPKRALRLGLAHTGRLSKFIAKASPDENDPDEELDVQRERCENAVLEGLRQLGYLPEPVTVMPPAGRRIPDDLVVVAVRILRLTEKRAFMRVNLPVAVVFQMSSPQVYAWLPDNKGLRPFYQAMLDLTTIDPGLVASTKKEQALERLRTFFEHELPREGVTDALILAEAQNVRATWTGMLNSEAVFDALRFERGATPLPLAKLPIRYRLVRVRTSERRETPEWYTEDAEPGRGYTSGVWIDPDAPRTFFNIGEKPLTQSRARRGKHANPREHYAIPSALEITVLAHEKTENPEQWAVATHVWRRMGYLTGGMTLLPIMLQWAQRMDRYAAVIGPWVFEEQWADDDVIDDDEHGEENVYEQLEFF